MAARDPLQRFHLHDIRNTGIEIGRGSYAVVRELEFRGLKCVAKEIHRIIYEEAAPADKAEMLQRFKDECNLLSRLHHPNIVQFLGVQVWENHGLPILVMEYLPTTLAACLDKHGVLPAEISLGILRDVAVGLCYLHQHLPSIIHRDLSANNVLLTPSMSAKISDLGVAKILDMSRAHAARMTQTQVPGTPAYMPPETMIARPKYTAKVDIFSMGVLIVHVLSGEWPIPTEAFAEDPQNPDNLVIVTEFNRRRHTIKKIEDRHPLQGLIQQCLSNVPSRRPDAVEVVHQLKEVCSRVSPSPESKLELLQQIQSLRAELWQSSDRQDIEALRRENMTLRAELSVKTQENSSLRREIESERQQHSLRIEALQSELSTKAQEHNTPRRTDEALLSERRQRDFVFSSGLRTEMERMRSLSATPDGPRTEIEPVWRDEVQRLQRVASSESPTEPSPHVRLQWKRSGDIPEKHGEAKAVVIERMRPVSATQDEPVLRTEVQRLIAQQRATSSETSTGQSPFTRPQWKRSADIEKHGGTKAVATDLRMRPVSATWQDGLRNETEPILRETSSKSTTGLSPHTRIQWKRCADVPEKLGGTKGVVIGERVCIRGWHTGNRFYQYDWLTDTWSALPDCPVQWSGMTHFLGKLVTIGGLDGKGSVTGKVYQLNEQAQRWEEVLSPMPTARCGLTVVTRTSGSESPNPADTIVACGGRDADEQALDAVEVYPHATSQWHTAKPLPIPCYVMTSTIVNDTCYILGGRYGNFYGTKHCFSGPLNSLIHDAISPRSRSDDPIWSSISDAPFSQSTAANLRGSLVTIGGSHTSDATTAAVHVLTSDGHWERVRAGDLPEPCRKSAAVNLPSGELLVIGGYYTRFDKKKSVFIASVIN